MLAGSRSEVLVILPFTTIINYNIFTTDDMFNVETCKTV